MFRRHAHQLILKEDYERLPYFPIEVMETWNLGGDGKSYFPASPHDEWFIRLMRSREPDVQDMERTGTGTGSLHFVYCLTEQVKINLPYVFYTVITRNITNSLLASGKPINFVSLHLKNHQNFKGVMTKEYSISRLLPVPTYKRY